MNSGKKSHRQNVDNLEKLSVQVATFEPVFNPSETRLSIPNQQQLKTRADGALAGIMAAESACNNAVSARTTAFNGFDGLVTRVINAVRISDVAGQTIEQAESIVRELRNKRASVNVPPSEPTEGIEKVGARRQNKMRSGSFNTKIENFSKLIVLLGTIPPYKPNETDLTIASLKVKHEALKLVNSICVTKDAEANAARNQRDIILYTERTGLVDIASDVKLYVKSAYGARSPQFKSVSGLAFSKLN